MPQLFKFVLAAALMAAVLGQWVSNGSFSTPNNVNEVNFSPDGNYLVVASQDNDQCIYSM